MSLLKLSAGREAKAMERWGPETKQILIMSEYDQYGVRSMNKRPRSQEPGEGLDQEEARGGKHQATLRPKQQWAELSMMQDSLAGKGGRTHKE